MAKIIWTVSTDGGGTVFTDRVLSMNITQGREKYLDNYSGGQCVITINNSGNYADGLTYGKNINVTGYYASGVFNCDFWVQEVVYDDYPGNTGLNTATIVCADWISRAGRINANNVVIAQALCDTQIGVLETAILPSDMNTVSFGSSSTASGTTYTGSFSNYLNLLVVTERGYCFQDANELFFIGRNYVSSLSPVLTTIGRTTGLTQIAYQTFQRIQNGTQFINTATVSPDGLSSQTSTNSSSVSTYGGAFYSSSTVDYNTTQALGNASWIANTFSDPADLRFACSFTDVMQNASALESWLGDVFNGANRTINLSYQVPGGLLTTTAVVMEGFTINVTPELAEFSCTFSPLDYYQFFTLNSSTLGILNTSRLGW